MFKEDQQNGFTLLELLVTVTVLSIVLMQVIPSMTSMMRQNQLKAVVDRLADDLRYAQSESIKRNSSAITVDFAADGTSDWCYGIVDSAACDCTITDPDAVNACSLDIGGTRVLKVAGSQQDQAIQLATAFTGSTSTSFDPVRGIATSGRATLTSLHGSSVQINVSVLGRISVCVENSGKLSGYTSC